MKKCFGYIRVSSIRQGDGVSLEVQKDAIKAFAIQNGISITQWFEEKETAAKCGRPIFTRMIKLLKRGKADGMVIHKIDRSARNLKDWASISDLSDAGVDVYFATESLDFRSRGGRLTADIQMVIAADYVRNLSFEARKGIHGRLKQGLFPWPAPLGYLNNGSGKVKTLDPIRAPLVKVLFELYLTGDYSIRTLHQEIVRRGLTSTHGKPISKHSVETILQNPFYCGLMRNGRSGEVFQGIHEALISSADYEKIQQIKQNRYAKKSTRHDHLFRKLFHCANCAALLSPERQKGNVYYRCHTKDCFVKTAREEVLNDALLQALSDLALSGVEYTKIENNLRAWSNNKDRCSLEKSLNLRISDADARLKRLTDLLVDGTIDQSTYSERRERHMLDVNKLREEQISLRRSKANDSDRLKFLELMKNPHLLYQSANSSEKRYLSEICFSNRTWNGKYVELKPSKDLLTALDVERVPYGGATRGTYRTFVEMFDKKRTSKKPRNEVWKKNFGNKDDKSDKAA